MDHTDLRHPVGLTSDEQDDPQTRAMAGYGIEFARVIQVVGCERLITRTGAPTCLTGTVHFQGQLTPVVDLRIGSDVVAPQCDDRTSVVIVAVRNVVFGIIVAAPLEVQRPGEDTVPLPVGKCSGVSWLKDLGRVADEVRRLNARALLVDIPEDNPGVNINEDS